MRRGGPTSSELRQDLELAVTANSQAVESDLILVAVVVAVDWSLVVVNPLEAGSLVLEPDRDGSQAHSQPLGQEFLGLWCGERLQREHLLQHAQLLR